MKTILLAGGLGTRLAEETDVRPKPMIEVGGRPLLWHVMNLYAAHGFNEFVVALGYKADYVKRWFLDYHSVNGDLTVDLATGRVESHDGPRPDWRVHLVDTGQATQTGGRVRRLRAHVQDGTFMMTYGDGVADVDLTQLLAFHRAHGRLATVTAVRPPARFGGLELDGTRVTRFCEKPLAGEGWINGGFFVLEPQVLDYIAGDGTLWEHEPMERLAADDQLRAYLHDGYWQPVDTLREKRILESLWESGKAPWKVWK